MRGTMKDEKASYAAVSKTGQVIGYAEEFWELVHDTSNRWTRRDGLRRSGKNAPNFENLQSECPHDLYAWRMPPDYTMRRCLGCIGRLEREQVNTLLQWKSGQARRS